MTWFGRGISWVVELWGRMMVVGCGHDVLVLREVMTARQLQLIKTSLGTICCGS